MTIVVGGLVDQFLDVIGIQVTTMTGYYIVFLTVSCLLGVTLISLMGLLFRFLVYLRRM